MVKDIFLDYNWHNYIPAARTDYKLLSLPLASLHLYKKICRLLGVKVVTYSLEAKFEVPSADLLCTNNCGGSRIPWPMVIYPSPKPAVGGATIWPPGKAAAGNGVGYPEDRHTHTYQNFSMKKMNNQRINTNKIKILAINFFTLKQIWN